MGDFRVWCAWACVLVAGARATGLGRCPGYPPLQDFQIERMCGTWYEVERSFYLMELVASCSSLNVTLNEKGYLVINVDTVNRWTGSPSTVSGLGIPNYMGAPSFRFRTQNRLPYALGRLVPGTGQYSVLATDYEKFALVWSCDSVGFAHADRIWVLGRTREITAIVRARIYGAMQQLGLDPDRLLASKNSNCDSSAANDTAAINGNDTVYMQSDYNIVAGY